MKVLVSNVGSTSLKFKLFEMPQEKVLCEGKVERVGSDADAIFSYQNPDTGFSVTEEGLSIPTYTDGIRRFLRCMTDETHGAIAHIREIEAVGFKTGWWAPLRPPFTPPFPWKTGSTPCRTNGMKSTA